MMTDRTQEHREYNATRAPLIALRMPNRAALEELQTVALQTSTSVSAFIREAIQREIERVTANTR